MIRLKSSSPPTRSKGTKPELVDDEHVDAEEPLLQPGELAGIARFEQLPHEIGRAGEEHAAFLLRRFDAERDREMRLAGADRAGEDQILGRGDPLAARERVDLRRADAVGGGEVEGVERLHLGKARLAQPLADHRLVARGLLGAEDLVQIVLVRPVRIARLARQGFKRARDAGQLQRARVRDDEIAGRAVAALMRAPPASQRVVVGGAAARRRRCRAARAGHRVERDARRRRRAGVRASSSGVPVASARGQRGHDDRGAVRVELAEDLGEEPRGLARPVRRVELIPDRRKRGAEIAQEIRQHLAHRLRLARELRQVMPVVDRPLPEALAADARIRVPSRPTIVTVVAPMRTTRSSPAQRLGTE